MTQQIIAMQVWRYVGGVLKCPGRADRPVRVPGSPPVVSPPAGGGGGGSTGNPRDQLVYGQYVPDDSTTGPLPGTVFTVLGTGPKYQGAPIFSWDTPGCPTDNVAAADWSNGTDYAYNCTSDGQIVENLEIWGSINLNGKKNVVIRNCIIHGDASPTGRSAPIFNLIGGENLLGLLIQDCQIIGRPIRVPDTYNGKALLSAGRIDPCNQKCNGLRGGNYTIKRTEIVRQPDGIGLTYSGGNVFILGCWIHRNAYCEWFSQDASGYKDSAGNVVAGAGFYPSAAGGSMYTHADCIQFHIGQHYRICGNTLGNYNGGASSGPYAHNADQVSSTGVMTGVPSDRLKILACEDFYNSNFQISQEVSSALVNQLQDIVIWRNFLGGGQSIVNWPIQNKYSPANPMPVRKAQDNWDDFTDPGVALWHNRIRTDNGSRNQYLIYNSHLPNIVDDLYDNGTPVKINRG